MRMLRRLREGVWRRYMWKCLERKWIRKEIIDRLKILYRKSLNIAKIKYEESLQFEWLEDLKREWSNRKG